MDGENAQYHGNNVVAGPCTVVQDNPIVFLPLPPASAPPQPHLASTQDLLARFHLHPAYNKHVRPPLASPQPSNPSPATLPNPVPHDRPPEGDDKKKKNSYRHLIKNVPGKHSMKKDEYLTTMMQAEAKQRIPIVEFDARTQREFVVSAEGLKGWNAGALILDPHASRKRKELKRMARAHVPRAPGR